MASRRKFLKNNKQVKETGAVVGVSRAAYGGIGFFISIMLFRLNFGIQNELAIPMTVLAACFLAFAFLTSFGVRYLVLEDDKMLYGKCENGENI